MKKWLLGLSVVSNLLGCNGHLQTTEKVISSSEAFVGKVALSFTVWDHQHQEDLANKAKSKDEATKALADYRTVRQPVLDAFHAVDGLITTAEAVLPMVESGLREEKDLVLIISQLGPAMAGLQKTFAALGFTPSVFGGKIP